MPNLASLTGKREELQTPEGKGVLAVYLRKKPYISLSPRKEPEPSSRPNYLKGSSFQERGGNGTGYSVISKLKEAYQARRKVYPPSSI